MLVSAAVCPGPLLLVPEFGVAHAEAGELRAACRTALDALVPSAPELVVVVGEGEATRRIDAEVADFTPWGVRIPVPAKLPAKSPEKIPHEPLPQSLAVGARLLAVAGWTVPAQLVSVRRGAGVDECRELGAALAEQAERVALLVVGDGSARRSPSGPRTFDERARGFDASVAQALGSGDPEELLALDD